MEIIVISIINLELLVFNSAYLIRKLRDSFKVSYDVMNKSIPVKKSVLKKGEMIETSVRIASWPLQINWEDTLVWEECIHSDFQHLFSPSNAFSDNRFIEREILRSFRTIFEHTNNIFTDPTKTSGKDIPAYLFYNYKEGQIPEWVMKIERLGECFSTEYKPKDLEKIQIEIKKKLLRGLGWNLDES